jgi:hypothetical protein
MRTTLTIDDEIAAKLKLRAKKAKNKAFEQIVNETLELGLRVYDDLNRSPKFYVRSRRMGYIKGLSYENVGNLLEQVEASNK